MTQRDDNTTREVHAVRVPGDVDALIEEFDPSVRAELHDAVATLDLAFASGASDGEFEEIFRATTEAASAGRFAPFVKRVAQHADLSVSRSAELLSRLDASEEWEPSPFEGVALFHLSGGPEVAEAIVGFVRVDIGQSFPEHDHIGRELCFILEGELRVGSEDAVYGAGDILLSEADTEHGAMVNAGDSPLVYLAVVFEGIRVADMELLPGDPRI